jgi:hypothetical protein
MSTFPEPLLLARIPKNPLSSCTKDMFMHLCNKIWSSSGLPYISGHSFKIGGTTSLLRAGASPYIVNKLERWPSDAYLHYLRDPENKLLTDHAANIDWVDFTID